VLLFLALAGTAGFLTGARLHTVEDHIGRCTGDPR
jgi:hypothetical protein